MPPPPPFNLFKDQLLTAWLLFDSRPMLGIYFFILFIFEPSVSTGIAVIEGRFDGDDEPIRCRVNGVVYKQKSS